ncbi:MAG: hypothetical protein HQL60_07500 [Magnetococcales bacterium]|nr:hypothetical protein [Magnetococcales bacterium]
MGLLARIGAIVLLAVLIYQLWKRWRSQAGRSPAQAQQPNPSRSDRTQAEQNSGSDADLVRCHHCRTLVPRAQAITTSFGQIYCGTPCLQQANQADS